MAKRKQVEDLGTVRVDPQATPNSSFFLAQSPSLGRGDSGFGDFIQSAAKLYGNIKLQEREEDIAQGEAMFQEKQAEIAEKMSKQETLLAGFSQAVSQDKIAEEKSPGMVIGYRRAAGRFFAQDYARRAQEALDKAINEEYAIDPNTTIPTAPRTPEQVLREVETKFEQDAENGSAKWLLKDFYGKQTYLDAKTQTSAKLLNEYRERFSNKQKDLHREMLAAEGVKIISDYNKLIDIGELSPAEARTEVERWVTDKVYLGSIKNPSEFVAGVVTAAIDRAQKDEAIRLDSPDAVPSDEEVGSTIFSRFKDLTVGTAPLSKSQALTFDRVESQLLQDKDRSLSRSNALYEAKRTRELNLHVSDPAGKHLEIIKVARDVDEFTARKQLDQWYSEALAKNVPFAEEKYNRTLQSLERTLNSTPDAVSDLRNRSEALALAFQGNIDLARDRVDNLINDPEVKLETYSKISQIEQTNLVNVLKDPTISKAKKDLSKFTGTKGLKAAGVDMILNDSLAEELFQNDTQDLAELDDTLLSIAAKKLSSGEEKAEIAGAIDATKKRIDTRYAAAKNAYKDVMKQVEELWVNNTPADEKIYQLLEEGSIGQRGFTTLMSINAQKTKFLSTEINQLLSDPETNKIIDRTFKIEDVREITASAGLIAPSKDSYNNSIYVLTPEGVETGAQIKRKAATRTAEFFQDVNNAKLVKDPVTRKAVIKDRYSKIVREELLNEIKSLPVQNNKEWIKGLKAKFPSLFGQDSFDKTMPDEIVIDKISDDQLAEWNADRRKASPSDIRSFLPNASYGKNAAGMEQRVKLSDDVSKYTPGKWSDFNAVGRYQNAGKFEVLFGNRSNRAAEIVMEELGIGDPRFMVETGIGLNSKPWKDKAREFSNILSNSIAVKDIPDTIKEAAITYSNSLTGLRFNDVIDGKYRYGGKEIPITRYDLINWKLTPLFASEQEMLTEFKDDKAKAMLDKLKIDTSNESISKFIDHQKLAIRRLN